ncbi:gag-protease polyprotein [Cucumis melo var. makuwa]|uniref:Gag-protease polyprotein n=1 Tax=Cucumis melo var. makuwa TaxID=1194695 RepID=A0A5A7UDF1_CUCMM|nr:gag-protease polyprotein [Cucumis melo var. makuwa]
MFVYYITFFQHFVFSSISKGIGNRAQKKRKKKGKRRRKPKISSSSSRCLPLANRRAVVVDEPCTSVSRRRCGRLRQQTVDRQNLSRPAPFFADRNPTRASSAWKLSSSHRVPSQLVTHCHKTSRRPRRSPSSLSRLSHRPNLETRPACLCLHHRVKPTRPTSLLYDLRRTHTHPRRALAESPCAVTLRLELVEQISSPNVLVFPPGKLQTSLSYVFLWFHRRPDYVPTRSHVARVRERASSWAEVEVKLQEKMTPRRGVRRGVVVEAQTIPPPAPVRAQSAPVQLSAEAKHVRDFRKYNPKTFDESMDNPTKAQMWLTFIEKIFRYMKCLDDQKVQCEVFFLEDRGTTWWETAERMLGGDVSKIT